MNDEESRHTAVSEETPLLPETVNDDSEASTIPTSIHQNDGDDSVAPVPLSRKRAFLVVLAVTSLLFIQGRHTGFWGLGFDVHTLTNMTSSYEYHDNINHTIRYCRRFGRFLQYSVADLIIHGSSHL